MAKFIFKMQNLLDIKSKLEEQKKAAFGLAKARLDEAERILELLIREKEQYVEKLRLSFLGHIDLLEVRKNEEAVKIVQMNIERQQIAVRQAKRQVDLAAIALNEAMKERKTYEKLREKAFEAFKYDLQKEESKEVDELTSFKYGKAKGGKINYG